MRSAGALSGAPQAFLYWELRFCFLLVLLRAGVPACAAVSASDVSVSVNATSLDPARCFRVDGLQFTKGNTTFRLAKGWLMFAKPINGMTPGAIFAAPPGEPAEGRVEIAPPTPVERWALARFVKAPVLREDFSSALMLFTDGTGEALEAELRRRNTAPERTAAGSLDQQWSPLFRHIASAFHIRLVRDLVAQQTDLGVFYAGMTGKKLGPFDFFYDPLEADRTVIGKVDGQDFNEWTGFATSTAPTVRGYSIADYNIDATIEPDLTVSTRTRARLIVGAAAARVFPVLLTRSERLNSVRIDDRPAEVFERESRWSDAFRHDPGREYLIVAPAPLAPGSAHKIEFEHEGRIIARLRDGTYAVMARQTWYPRIGYDFTSYELTMRYQPEFAVLATGTQIQDGNDGLWRVTRWRSPAPMRFAAFNFGRYESAAQDREDLHVRVFANQPGRPPSDPDDILPVLAGPPEPEIGNESLKPLTADISDAFSFFSTLFGPPASNTLAVTPAPGGLGQSFTGLTYLPSFLYSAPNVRARSLRSRFDRIYYPEVLPAHEVAHQWFGNLVSAAEYRDEWIIEAAAEYSSLLYLERKKGRRAVDEVLALYYKRLTEAAEGGTTLAAVGPLAWGYRLQSPEARRAITYGKGAWFMDALRRQLGDERFRALLRSVCEQYRFRPIATSDFRDLAIRQDSRPGAAAAISALFDRWIFGTEMPPQP